MVSDRGRQVMNTYYLAPKAWDLAIGILMRERDMTRDEVEEMLSRNGWAKTEPVSQVPVVRFDHGPRHLNRAARRKAAR